MSHDSGRLSEIRDRRLQEIRDRRHTRGHCLGELLNDYSAQEVIEALGISHVAYNIINDDGIADEGDEP